MQRMIIYDDAHNWCLTPLMTLLINVPKDDLAYSTVITPEYMPMPQW